MSAGTRPARQSKRQRQVALLTLTFLFLGVGMLVAIVVFWQGVAELAEPFWTLALYGRLSESREGAELAVAPGSSVALHREARPHTLPDPALQKGLVWRVAGEDQLGSGLGLGVPMVVVNGQTYVSRTAEVIYEPYAGLYHLRKIYTLDAVATAGRPLQRRWRAADPIGQVIVDYELDTEGVIEVAVDLSGLQVAWDEAIIANRLDARTFVVLSDDADLHVQGSRIGEQSLSRARSACLSDGDLRQFCVAIGQEGALQPTWARGLRLNWHGLYAESSAGIDVLVPGQTEHYAYEIMLSVSPD